MVEQNMVQKQMRLKKKNEFSVHVSNNMNAVMLLTLVACLNITNGRFFRVAASCSAPIMIPLSMSTALDRTKVRIRYIRIYPVLTQRIEFEWYVHALFNA